MAEMMVKRTAVLMCLELEYLDNTDPIAESALRAARTKILRLPYAEAEPVKHGRWVPVDGESPCDEWDCTACNVRQTFLCEMDEDDMREDYKRCPNCGAKMDLEEI